MRLTDGGGKGTLAVNSPDRLMLVFTEVLCQCMQFTDYKKTHPKVREGCNVAREVNNFDMQRHHRSAITVNLEPLEYPRDVDHYMSNCGLAIRLATSGSLPLDIWQDD